jgi:hypothetical protein
MKEKITPGRKQTTPQDQKTRIPWKFNWEVKDLVDPIVLRRAQIFRTIMVVAVLILAGAFIWNQYLKASSGDTLVDEMVTAAGGMDAWYGVDQGKFTRTHHLYDDNGSVLKTVDETFYFRKTNRGVDLMVKSINERGDEIWVGRDDDGFWAFSNNEEVDPIAAAKDEGMMCDSKFCDPLCASTMAFYRFSMPFKLTDPGVQPKNVGAGMLDGKKADILEISYDPEVGKDRWVFYADHDNRLIGKIEYHHQNDHGESRPEEMYWSDHRQHAGITFANKWVRYHTNGKILEEFLFSDVDFETPVSEHIFSRPESGAELISSL